MKKYSSTSIMYRTTKHEFFCFFPSFGKGKDFYSPLHARDELTKRKVRLVWCDSFQEFEDDVGVVIGVSLIEKISNGFEKVLVFDHIV